jgi:hypothetical protein
LSVGVHASVAFVGNVGGGDCRLCLGDTVNTAARLQALANPGQMVISDALCGDVSKRTRACRCRSWKSAGRSDVVHVLSLNARASPRKSNRSHLVISTPEDPGTGLHELIATQCGGSRAGIHRNDGGLAASDNLASQPTSPLSAGDTTLATVRPHSAPWAASSGSR